MIVCKYEVGELSGLECSCESCQKIRDLLHQQELGGEVHITGSEEDRQRVKR